MHSERMLRARGARRYATLLIRRYLILPRIEFSPNGYVAFLSTALRDESFVGDDFPGDWTSIESPIESHSWVFPLQSF